MGVRVREGHEGDGRRFAVAVVDTIVDGAETFWLGKIKRMESGLVFCSEAEYEEPYFGRQFRKTSGIDGDGDLERRKGGGKGRRKRPGVLSVNKTRNKTR